jgi:uridylate kinase
MSSSKSDQSVGAPAAAAAPGGPRYRRVLLKISGEALGHGAGVGIEGQEVEIIAREIAAAAKLGSQLAVVVGGGNIIRGAKLAQEGRVSQAVADYMGMLGTAINGLALKEALEKIGTPARVLSAINLPAVSETFIRGRAMRHLEKGRVVIFVAGTGNPFFTTDTAAALRATEIGADVLLKATKVDGVYDRDPLKDPAAKKFDTLTFREALARNLRVMDSTALAMCMEHRIPVVVFNMKQPGNIAKVVSGQPGGTRLTVD